MIGENRIYGKKIYLFGFYLNQINEMDLVFISFN